MRVAVIGAGMAGASVARLLFGRGMQVSVFEKARGAGGRMSTRRTEWGGLDQGAQYFTMRDPRFESFIAGNVPKENLAEWKGRFAILNADGLVEDRQSHPRYVGVGGMNRIVKAVLGELPLYAETRIVKLRNRGGEWLLDAESGQAFGPFGMVIIAIPPAQAAALVRPYDPAMKQRLDELSMSPCITAMLRMKKPHHFPYDGIRCDHPVLGWVANQHSKPGGGEAGLVIHSSYAWAESHLDVSTESLLPLLLDAAGEAFSMRFGEPLYASCHRWRYATPESELSEPFLYNQDMRLGLCGDWCQAGRVEGAFLSAMLLADAVSGR